MGLSIGHLIILLIIVLIFGGGKRLPELGGALGKGIRSFKKGLDGSFDGIEEESAKIAASSAHAITDQSEKSVAPAVVAAAAQSSSNESQKRI